jgi:hypothetical protein
VPHAYAKSVCAEVGCWRHAVKRGRCAVHFYWPKRNPLRADGRTIRKLRDRLARKHGYRCVHPDASERTCTRGDFPLEVHHLDGDVTNNALDNLELRCRRHNPRGAGLHRKNVSA